MLILASASKSRSKLLKQAGISHKVLKSGIDEDSFHAEDICDLVKILALAKARSVAKNFVDIKHEEKFFNKNCFVLGCDSLFEFEGEIFGKPNNSKEAFDRWKRMSSSFGYIHTGHCLLLDEPFISKDIIRSRFDRSYIAVITTKIFFNKMTDRDIQQYISTGEPMKCAGGFALEGIGGMFIDQIEGCYSNVIGLSLPWLRNTLKKTNSLF